MSYFEHANTVEDIKMQYRRLAMKHHPDRGGSVEVMQEINALYQYALLACDRQTNEEGFTYYYDETVESEIMEMVDNLLKLKMKKVEINLIGKWVWITGDTRTYKEELKSLKCKWHGKRIAWYWHNGKHRAKRSGQKFDQLAKKYGCTTFEQPKSTAMATRSN